MKTYLHLTMTALALGAFACGGEEEKKEPCNQAVGNICAIAGMGENGYSGDEGSALEARMSLPQDVLVADDGTIYVLDWNNHRVRKITTDGLMKHVAGRGELGGTLDDPANNDFNHPTGLIFNADKTKILVAAWHNSKIREIDLATLAVADKCGDGRRAYFGDEAEAATASLDLPASLALDPNGDLIVMDQANQVLRRIDQAGMIHRYAGICVIDSAPPAGPGPCAEGVAPTACPAPSGKYTCGVPAETCMRPCSPSYAGDGGSAMDMRISQPFGQSADPAGRIVFDDRHGHADRRHSADGRRRAARLFGRRRTGDGGEAQQPGRPRAPRGRHAVLHRRVQPLRAEDRSERDDLHRRGCLRHAGQHR
jgi:hypothetical protein